jgi:hypothetical protein
MTTIWRESNGVSYDEVIVGKMDLNRGMLLMLHTYHGVIIVTNE